MKPRGDQYSKCKSVTLVNILCFIPDKLLDPFKKSIVWLKAYYLKYWIINHFKMRIAEWLQDWRETCFIVRQRHIAADARAALAVWCRLGSHSLPLLIKDPAAPASNNEVHPKIGYWWYNDTCPLAATSITGALR